MMRNKHKAHLGFLSKMAKVMPEGAGPLFFIQIFSTLSFSVLYSSLFLYMRGALGIDDAKASSITGFFIAFNFALHLIGGYIGGKILSNRFLFAIGMFLQIVGCLFLSQLSIFSLYWGLAAFLAGSGLNVTCINCMLTQRYGPTDNRREAAFFWNYSGMNMGFFIGFSLSGYFQLQAGYKNLFLLSSAGNFIALLLLFYFWKGLKDTGTTLARFNQKKQSLLIIFGLILIASMLPLLHQLAIKAEGANNFIMVLGGVALVFILLMTFNQESLKARNKLLAFIALMAAGLVFWTLYQMVPMGITLFIVQKVNANFFGLEIAPQWLQNINTVVLIIGGPVMSILLANMRDKGINVSIPIQFTLALILIGLGYAILPIGIYFAGGGLVSIHWIMVCYLLQSIAELLISPVGYAMIGRLAPSNMQGVLMGTWMMVTGVAATFSSRFSHMMIAPSTSTSGATDNFSYVFTLLGLSAIAAGILLYFISPWLSRLMDMKTPKKEAKTFNKEVLA